MNDSWYGELPPIELETKKPETPVAAPGAVGKWHIELPIIQRKKDKSDGNGTERRDGSTLGSEKCGEQPEVPEDCVVGGNKEGPKMDGVARGNK